MSRNKSLVLLAGAALGMASSASLAQSLQDAYRAELLSDAGSRTSLLAAAGSVHHENGHFGARDASGNNSFNVFTYGSARVFFNIRDDDSVGDNDDFTEGGQIAYFRAGAFGTVGSSNMEYYIEVGADPVGDFDSDDDSSSGGQISLLDFFAKYNFDGGTYLIFGQGKPSQGLEEMAHEAFQQRLERSIPNDIFATKRQQFIGFGGAMEQVDWQVFVSDGANQPNVDFWQPSEADIAIGGAINGYFQGGPQDFIGKAQSAFKGGPTAFRGGISAQWETHGETGIGTSEFDAIFGTAGLEYKNGNGLSARGYLYVLNADPSTGDDFFHWGASGTVGYFFNPNWEVYGGVDALFFDEDSVSSGDEDLWFIIVGLNYFPFEGSSAVRFTAEGIYSLNESADLFSGSTTTGTSGFNFSRHNLLGSSEDGEFGVGIGAAIFN